MIDRDHPAVKATWKALTMAQGTADGVPFISAFPSAFRAALLHLDADDLRHTHAGRALMAEAWDTAVFTDYRLTGLTRVKGFRANPYRPDTPNPYRGENP